MYGSAIQPGPANYQYQAQVGVAGVPRRDPTIAFLLELLGYVGFLGIGHMYAGHIGRGLVLMGTWAIYWGIVLIMFVSLIGIPLAILMALSWPVVPVISGFWARGTVERANYMTPVYYG